jgi:formylglycine-generating enzyme required for sulfatase activity
MDGSVLVWIPPGRFRMGNDEGTLEERPEHRVTFSRGFFLGKFELTWGKFQRFWLATRGEQLAPRGFEGDGPPSSLVDEQPVHGVGFPVAMEYAKWAGLRLPLEAEWEYAARGPKWLPYPWGREPLAATRANVGVLPDDSADAYPFTSPVGSFPAGRAPFGCLDMVGNVREWTVISGLGYPPAATEVVDPKPAEALAPLPSQRGGSYFDGVGNATPTSRVMLGVIAAEVEIDVGIRVARSAD